MDVAPTVDSALERVVQREGVTRAAVDSFIDSLGDEMRAAPSAHKAITAALTALQKRNYTSAQIYIAGSQSCLLFAGYGSPAGMVPSRTRIPRSHPVLELLVGNGLSYQHTDLDTFPFHGGVIGFPFERHSPILKKPLQGAVVVTYDPACKELNSHEERLIERTAGFIGDRVLQLQELGHHLRIERAYHSAAQQLADLRQRDRITGLYHNGVLWKDLDTYLQRAREGQGKYHLLLVDVDNMKALNHRGGHLLGDQYIADIAAYLQGIPAAKHYRAVADKFALMLEEGDGLEVVARARAIRGGLARVAVPHDVISPRTFSMGLVESRPEFTNGHEWYLLADNALTEAKERKNAGVRYLLNSEDLKASPVWF